MAIYIDEYQSLLNGFIYLGSRSLPVAEISRPHFDFILSTFLIRKPIPSHRWYCRSWIHLVGLEIGSLVDDASEGRSAYAESPVLLYLN